MMITEDGSGVPGANSYAGNATATDYLAIRMMDGAWSALAEPERSAKLVLATDYLEATYRPSAPRLSPAQGLQWPVEGSTAVPAPIVAATILLASYAISGPLMAPAERGVSKTSKKLEGVGELTSEFDSAPSDPFPAITSMLAGVASLRTVEAEATASGTGKLVMGRLTR